VAVALLRSGTKGVHIAVLQRCPAARQRPGDNPDFQSIDHWIPDGKHKYAWFMMHYGRETAFGCMEICGAKVLIRPDSVMSAALACARLGRFLSGVPYCPVSDTLCIALVSAGPAARSECNWWVTVHACLCVCARGGIEGVECNDRGGVWQGSFACLDRSINLSSKIATAELSSTLVLVTWKGFSFSSSSSFSSSCRAVRPCKRLNRPFPCQSFNVHSADAS
jgi:hypothetical protein